jgi:hypothetical protein
LLSGFEVLLDMVSGYMRINPRNVLACGYALSLQSRGTMKLTPRNAAAIAHYVDLVGITPLCRQ